MAVIVTRAGKGSPLTNAEVDANFTNLNTELGDKLSLSGGNLTGLLATMESTSVIADPSGAGTGLDVRNDGTPGSAAFFTLHRQGAYAVRFGLDTDNVLKVGGWSMGAVAYAIYHQGNKPAKSDVGLGNVDNTSDANKPVSTAQQAALDLKASINSSTGALQVPGGTTAQRFTGYSYSIRYNEDDDTWEGWNGSAWGSIGGGAEGSGGEQIFIGSDATMNNAHTLQNGRNYIVAGPCTINNTLTFGDGVVTFI